MTTIATMLAAHAKDDRTAIIDASGSLTWRDSLGASALRGAVAAALYEDAKGDPGRENAPFHIGVLLPNVPEYLFWLQGAALAGAAIVGINPTRRGEALAADVRATDCQIVVTDADGAELLRGLDLTVPEDRVLTVGTDAYASLLAAHEHTTAADPRPAPEGQGLIARAGEVPGDSLYLLLFTSGTTGTPKAVRCTQGRLAGIGESVAPGYGYRDTDICYCPMPLFHGNALMALWAPALHVGAAIALRPRFSASAFLDDVRRYRATKFNYVGKTIAYILATPERPDDADNTLVSAFGTEASVQDRSRFKKRFGCVLLEGYGQSEGGCALNPVPGTPLGSMGRPVGGFDLAILHPETAQECPPARFDAGGRILNAGDATGEIVNRSGRGGFEGYYGAPDAENERLRNGWYWTGDLGYKDEQGYFYFAGRRGDWLRVDGENFSAGPIESLLSRHPDVSVAAVYAVADTRSGDQVMAALELVPGATFDPDAFASWLAAQPDLGTKWAPRYVRIMPTLPVTATGKVTKASLQQEAWDCTDPVWWRADRRDAAYRLLTDEERAKLAAELAEHGRADLVGRT